MRFDMVVDTVQPWMKWDLNSVCNKITPTKIPSDYVSAISSGASRSLQSLSGIPSIKKIIYSNPATVILWNDGTKTVAKCDKGDTYNKEIGYLICVLKKVLPKKEFYKMLNEFYSEKKAEQYE